jgi:hypothetical protein
MTQNCHLDRCLHHHQFLSNKISIRNMFACANVFIAHKIFIIISYKLILQIQKKNTSFNETLIAELHADLFFKELKILLSLYTFLRCCVIFGNIIYTPLEIQIYMNITGEGKIIFMCQIVTHQLLRKVLSIWVLNCIIDCLWN